MSTIDITPELARLGDQLEAAAERSIAARAAAAGSGGPVSASSS